MGWLIKRTMGKGVQLHPFSRDHNRGIIIDAMTERAKVFATRADAASYADLSHFIAPEFIEVEEDIQ